MWDILLNLLWIIGRYMHVVATTFLVGGTLFYEFVVPLAIADLKEEQQLSVHARSRWIFRRIVYVSAAILLITGISSSIRNFRAYNGGEVQMLKRLAFNDPQTTLKLDETRVFGNPMLLWAAHGISGFLSVMIAVLLVRGGSPPTRLRQWMRLNIVLLLVAIFLASATRNARLRMFQWVQESPINAEPTDPSLQLLLPNPSVEN